MFQKLIRKKKLIRKGSSFGGSFCGCKTELLGFRNLVDWTCVYCLSLLKHHYSDGKQEMGDTNTFLEDEKQTDLWQLT